MSIQLSLFWQSADNVDWYWQGDGDIYKGSIEELADQKKQRNLTECQIRLFLPGQWFSLLEIKLPLKSNRINDQMLRFAAEEYLAQDIDSVHLILKNKPVNGLATLLVTELDRLRQLINLLKQQGFLVIEAFNAQQFSIPTQQTDDVLIRITQANVAVCSNDQVINVHPQGFGQWFEIWSQQTNLDDNVSIKILSPSSEGDAKALVTQLEASGLRVEWVVEDSNSLADWHENANSQKHSGNLIAGVFNYNSANVDVSRWLPIVAASVVSLIIWSALIIYSNTKTHQQTEQVWLASENVFLQVFGNSKRIQRPLMAREMRSKVAISDGVTEVLENNALTILSDLSDAAPSLVLEDFRYNAERNEAYFTLVQSLDVEGDAYTVFEALKTGLSAKGYQVEYSAKQEQRGFKAQFKSVFGGQG